MKGVFKCAREDDKKIQKCQPLKLGDALVHPQEIFKKTQASKLGDAPRASPSPSTLSVRLPFHYIFITSCVMCYAWSVLLLVSFLFSLAFNNESELSFLCVGEKHAPLQTRTYRRIFMSIFAMCVLYFSIATFMLSS